MAEKKCCIHGCTSSSSRYEDIGVTFHKFPKDPDLYNTWINVTHINPNIENVLYVCSRHFCKNDFQMYQESKYVLKSGAIPSIFCWTMAESTKNSEAPLEDIFKDNHVDNVILNSSKELEPKNLESIKKIIEDEQPVIKNANNLESSDDLGLSVTALDVIHKSQDLPIIANSVMNMIVNVEPKSCEKDTVALSIGSKVEAKDFSCHWHSASIVEVDYDESEVLVHYDDSSNMPDEWISVSSSRLRPYNPNRTPELTTLKMPPKPIVQSSETLSKDENKMEDKKKVTFIEGERCLARWRDNKRCMATIQKDLGDSQYEIMFDDGFQWKCSVSRLHKLKDASSKPLENLSVDTSVSGNICALSPVTTGPGPLGTPPFHTHLFDPTRDYLGSKSERREMKRKLNIKEIFNIGQKKRKTKPDDIEQKGVKKKVKVEPKMVEIKKELPDAVASIIGTVDEKIHEEVKQETTEDDGDVSNDKITLDDLTDTKDKDTSYMSDSDPNNCSDPVSNEEDTLERFDKPDESVNEAVIDKMKEVISKLENGLNEAEESVEADTGETAEPEVNLEVIQVDPNDVEIDLETEETVKIESEVEEVKPEPTLEEEDNVQVKMEEKPKKVASKVKKSKKLRLLHEKKVKKQVERVKNELEEMKRQVEEMRKQMLQKTEELAAHHQQRPPHEMPESFLLPGEWCCRWVNGEPVGQVHETEAEPRFDANNRPALPRRTVLVEDKRLPPGWKKIMVRRSLGQSAGKWDVVLVSPDQKRFHTKQEMRMYLEQGEGELKAYEYALLDFSVHLKLSRRMGWVSNTAPSQAPAPVSNVSPFLNTKKLTFKKDGKKRLKIRKPNYILQRQEGETAESNDPTDVDMQNPPIENGFIFVGSLKVQVIDSLLRCPAEGCLKNFRNNTLLKMHIKHYHRELKKMLGKTPKVLDLAYARARPTGEKLKKKSKVIKTKIPKKFQAEPKSEASESQPELRVNLTPLPLEELPHEDSPKLRQALVPKPLKRPKVLLPVRRPEPENGSAFEETGSEEGGKLDLGTNEVEECVDFEAAISTHTVTKPCDFKSEMELKPRLTFSEDEDWPLNSDFETRSSCPGSATPDSKTMDKTTPNLAVSSESNEEAKHREMYMYTESGERIKIERMRREEIINCHCGFREEDGLMVQCELCLCWQHALCHNIRTEAEVPEKYTCSICLNPRRGRRSKRFLHDQDRLFEGLLPGAKPCDFLRRSHELSGNLIRIQDALHAMRVKYFVATKKNHPKLYLWAKDWENAELNFTQERLNSDYSDLNIIINNIGKENLPVKSGPDDERDTLLNLPGTISGMPLDFPISTTELERMARSIQEQECRVSAPQPEAAIENSVCRERLLRHVQRSQAQIDSRLDSIEAQVAELESQDPSFEDDETADYFPRTKQTIQMLMRDLETMEELGVIT